jgi:RimJ/RimL family protein N-acetyltransferase
MRRIITTQRLHLRTLVDSDATAIADQIGDYDVAHKLSRVPYPYHLSDANEFLAWDKTGDQKKTRRSAICLRETPEDLRGAISIEWHEEKQCAELGYWLAKPLWGKGLMTEAVAAVVEHAFTIAHIDHLVACFFKDNPASGKVLLRNGFEIQDDGTCFSRAQGCNVAMTNVQLSKVRWQSLQKILAKTRATYSST